MATNKEKQLCAEREVNQRKRVYPGLIERQTMSKAHAKIQIALMEEIAADYAALAEKDKLL